MRPLIGVSLEPAHGLLGGHRARPVEPGADIVDEAAQVVVVPIWRVGAIVVGPSMQGGPADRVHRDTDLFRHTDRCRQNVVVSSSAAAAAASSTSPSRWDLLSVGV